MAVRRSTAITALIVAIYAAPVFAQSGGTLVSGPLTWTPVFQIREAGVDSNVFNASADPKQDVTGGLGGYADGNLDLSQIKLTMHGQSEYEYFERYRSQSSVNSNVNARLTLPFTYFQPSFYGTFLRAKDRSTDEFDLRALHHDHSFGAAIAMNIGQRFSMTADANRFYVNYAHGSDVSGVDLATQLNRRSSNVTPGAHVTLTPFTSLDVTAGFGLDEFDARPLNNTENIRGSAGFTFSPNAVISGHAAIGYHKMYPEYRQLTPGGALDFSGLTSAVDLSYTLLSVTRFGAHFGRDTSYSISTTAPYYLSTTGGLDITQTLGSSLMLLLRASRNQLAYPTTALAASHSDFADIYGGGLQLTLSNTAHVALNYDYADRRSGSDASFNYDRRHIYTTITYGF